MWKRIALAALVLPPVLWFGVALLPRSLFYRDRRPTRLGKLANDTTGWLAAQGIGPWWQMTLETKGRRSGRTVSTVLVEATYDGQEYLVSMLGERSAWVRNVRAAGGEAVIRHGHRRRVRLEDVPVDERAPIIKAYLQRAYNARPHFDVPYDAPIEEFERVAADYPAFRIVEMEEAAAAGVTRAG
jgi:deazaflavin-dependent oxidoreductase (nitroreductase family)